MFLYISFVHSIAFCAAAIKLFAIFKGVVKKHDFRGIQRKIPQISDFTLKQDSNLVPSGDTAADIAKQFQQNLQRKSDFREKLFSQFFDVIIRKHPIFADCTFFWKCTGGQRPSLSPYI
jgi:hypothetical protein